MTSAFSCSAPFYKILVPTVDTVRYNFLVKALVMGQYPVLLTGPVGTGKTSVAQSVLHGLDKTWTALTVNMSSQVFAFAWSVFVCLSANARFHPPSLVKNSLHCFICMCVYPLVLCINLKVFI